MSVESLTPKQTADLRGILEQRRSFLKSSMQRALHVDETAELRGTEPTDADWSTADVEAELALSRLERDQNELNAIEEALNRLQAGEYATCEACGADIGYPRLLAYPTATYCLSCQEKLEALRARR